MLLKFTGIPEEPRRGYRDFPLYIDSKNILCWGVVFNQRTEMLRTGITHAAGLTIVKETPEEVAEMVLRAMPENEREIISAPPRERVDGEPQANDGPHIHLA